MRKRSLKITSRFALVLVVAVPSLLAVALAGFHGLQTGRTSATRLYHDQLTNTQVASNLAIALEDAQQDIFLLLLVHNPGDRQRLTGELLSKIAPDIETDIAKLRQGEVGFPSELASTEVIAAAWVESQQLFTSSVMTDPNDAVRAAAAERFTAIYNGASAAAQSIVQSEALQATKSELGAADTYRANLWLMAIAVLLGLAAVIGIVLWLIRSVLNRTLAYSAFASDVTHGDYSNRLSPRGGDELAELGRTLDNLAEQRQAEDAYEHTQLEFGDALQQTESEREAQNLLKRHLELTTTARMVTVFNRNNSADRLEPVTAIPADSPLIGASRTRVPAPAWRCAWPAPTSTEMVTKRCCHAPSAPIARRGCAVPRSSSAEKSSARF